MAVTVSLAGVQSSTGVDAAAHRRALVAPLAHTSGAQPRAGILPTVGGGLAVTPGSGLSVNVASGAIVIPAPNAAQGGWTVYNDGVLTLTLAAASASNPRIDLIIARVADPFYYSGGDGQPAIKVITGTAASSPSVPAVPSTEGAYVVLKQITVAANATSVTAGQIADYATPVSTTAAAGGVMRLATTAARDAALASGAIYPGMSVWVEAVKEEHKLTLDLSTGGTRWLRSSAWRTFTPLVFRNAASGLNNNTLSWSTCKGWFALTDSVVRGGFTLTTGGSADINDGGAGLHVTPPLPPASVLTYGNVNVGSWRGDGLPGIFYYHNGPPGFGTDVTVNGVFVGTVTWTSGSFYFQTDAPGAALVGGRNLPWYQYVADAGNLPTVTAEFSYPVD